MEFVRIEMPDADPVYRSKTGSFTLKHGYKLNTLYANGPYHDLCGTGPTILSAMIELRRQLSNTISILQARISELDEDIVEEERITEVKLGKVEE